MKVYVVLGGCFYEDYRIKTMKVFSSIEEAKKYEHTLTVDGFYDEYYDNTVKYDYADIFEQEIQQ